MHCVGFVLLGTSTITQAGESLRGSLLMRRRLTRLLFILYYCRRRGEKSRGTDRGGHSSRFTTINAGRAASGTSARDRRQWHHGPTLPGLVLRISRRFFQSLGLCSCFAVVVLLKLINRRREKKTDRGHVFTAIIAGRAACGISAKDRKPIAYGREFLQSFLLSKG